MLDSCRCRWSPRSKLGFPTATANPFLPARLNFLNKKTWHPARPQNLEEVWKREQQAAAEAKKAEELRKQLEEERKRSEFVQMAMDTGHMR
jgi:hypothetical protein